MSLCVIQPLRRVFRALALTVALAVPVAAQMLDSPAVGTMPEDYLPGLSPLLKSALQQSPRMIANQMQIAVADAQKLANGLAPMLPSLNGGMQYGSQSSSVSGGGAASTNSGLFYNVQVNQAIFQWGALKNQLEVQKVAETISERNYAEGYRIFAATLRRQYLALVAGKINLRNARFSLKLAQNALAVAQERLKTGAISSAETITPSLDVEDRQLWFDRSEESYQYARRTLAHEAGLTDLPDDSIPGEIPLPKYASDTASGLLAGLLRDGARDTFPAQIDELNIKQQKMFYNIAKVRLLPKFSTYAGISQQNQTNATPNAVEQTAVTNEFYWLQAQWTIFDGLATRGQKLQALYNRRYYERLLQATAEETMDQAQNARRNLDFAFRAMNLAERRRSLASGALTHVLDGQKLGNVSQDTVNGATDGLNQNELAATSARADFLSAWSDFVSLVGADPAMKNLPARYVRPVH